MSNASTLPPIGAYAMQRDDNTTRTVYKIVAIRGRVVTSAGALVAPSAWITIENVKNKERDVIRASDFARDYFWECLS